MVLEYESGHVTSELHGVRRTLAQDIHFSVAEGESLALIGETGSGKTLTALAIMGLLPENVRAAGSRIVFLGDPMPDERGMRGLLGTSIAYIPQNGLEALDPSRTVRRHMYDSLKKAGVPLSSRRAEALSRLGAAGFEKPEEIMKLYPFRLSGGMAQRVVTALAACSRARLIIADEPTNGLDAASRRGFMERLSSMFPDAARLVITHDVSLASLCSRAVVLCGGRVMERGGAKELLASPLCPYTRALIAALPENGMAETPVLRAGDSPCPFYRRCPEASDACLASRKRVRRGEREMWCHAEG